MTRTTVDSAVFTKENTPIPVAAPLFQRDPAPTIHYRLTDRRRDALAGFRDRKRVSGDDVGGDGFVTDWLAGLQHASHENQEKERKSTRAAISVLDDMIVGHRGTVALIDARMPEIDRQIDAIASSQIDDAALSTGEQFESVEQRVSRRARERDVHADSIRTQRQQLSAQRDHAVRQIDICLRARISHWEQLLVRCAELDAYYNRRARTYARSATRRACLPISASGNLITLPQWCTPDALPDPA